MDFQEKLNALNLKRAKLISQLEMLSTPSTDFYSQLGKCEAEIHLLKKQIIRESKNPLDEN